MQCGAEAPQPVLKKDRWGRVRQSPVLCDNCQNGVDPYREWRGPRGEQQVQPQR
jgi:hypothetical protein